MPGVTRAHPCRFRRLWHAGYAVGCEILFESRDERLTANAPLSITSSIAALISPRRGAWWEARSRNGIFTGKFN
jgi:hypothetical protein